MTSEAPESPSPIIITETEHTVRSSASDPTMTDRTAESIFLGAMNALPGKDAGNVFRDTSRGRTENPGAREHFRPPTNSWGQSQPAWANSGPTRPSEVSLGQSSPMHSTVHQGCLFHTLAVHTHPGPPNAPAASSQQYGQSNPIVSPLQAPLFPLDSHLHYSSAILMAAHTHPGQTQGAYLAPPSPITTAETPVQAAQQQRSQNDGQQVPRPVAAQQELPSRGLRFEDVRRMIGDGLAQRRPEAPRYTKPEHPEKPRAWNDLLPEALWAYRVSKRSATGVSPYALTYGHDAIVPIELKVRSLRVTERPRQEEKDYTQAMAHELEDLEQTRIDACNLMQAQKQIAARAYNRKVRHK
ncbi:unnamed protein product, partial [Prunus brigantina]